ncbi:XRE family transcriptional regulator [Vibrio cholerae]|uniref:helix-turn-helix domain-containing protein n=2 Tax=Vibrio cholerae TaxID=666 RepID=UPI00155EF8D8|nr:helix-turn-helix transcriptional regulator [Vibrio cholerae]MBJ6911130.1 helix-turn-helix transcriptional regulator [Vibrio cholerae]MBJ6922588.1 helix-turn-helix transcriptional regulator [Vibrio cholerae]MVB91065.1 XRE family transcriptional regulator [Vibrio cholerae]NOE78259.1 helix-turn-helix domain-containing protein [Vibrio cholerae]
MTYSVFSKKYEIFRLLLVSERKEAGVTQRSLAEQLGKPQSFVSKYENGERRIDLVEFLDIAAALQFDAYEFIKNLEGKSKNES